ncbi:MAG: AAA-like domain-containing protein [Spirulina sp.]
MDKPMIQGKLYRVPNGSLKANDPTYVWREADDELFDKLMAGEFCYVLNARQMGKSSLCVRTVKRLREVGVACGAIDLSGFQRVGEPLEWYKNIIHRMMKALQLSRYVDWQTWWRERAYLSPLELWTEAIEDVLFPHLPEKIVIFIDEIDSVLARDFSTDDLFVFIRACYNQRAHNPEYDRLTFCLLGVAAPSRLIEDKRRTPFNIGQAILMTGLRWEHAIAPLTPVLATTVADATGVLREILHWTGGQPFLTQKAIGLVVRQGESKPDVEWVIRQGIVENWRQKDNPQHLKTIEDRVKNSEWAGDLLELYRRVLREESEGLRQGESVERSELLLSGLAVATEKGLRVYNPIYRLVFDEDWIELALDSLRPFAAQLKAWEALGDRDGSRLLQGQALAEALVWAKGKNLMAGERKFLQASQDLAARLAREKKDREATEKRNRLLEEANQKARRRERIGMVVLGVTLFLALGSLFVAVVKGKEAVNAEAELQTLTEEIRNSEELSQYVKILARKSEISESEESDEEEKELRRVDPSNMNYKQVNFHYLKGKAKHLMSIGNKTEAMRHYANAFQIVRVDRDPRNPNQDVRQNSIPFDDTIPLRIISQQDIEAFHEEMIEVMKGEAKYADRRKEAKYSLLYHYLDELESFLDNESKLQDADRLTWKMIEYIATIPDQHRYVTVESLYDFDCKALGEMDRLWSQKSKEYSDGKIEFGFKRQGEILKKYVWEEMGEKLEDLDFRDYYKFEDSKNWPDERKQKWLRAYYKFATAIEWYSEGIRWRSDRDMKWSYSQARTAHLPWGGRVARRAAWLAPREWRGWSVVGSRLEGANWALLSHCEL